MKSPLAGCLRKVGFRRWYDWPESQRGLADSESLTAHRRGRSEVAVISRPLPQVHGELLGEPALRGECRENHQLAGADIECLVGIEVTGDVAVHVLPQPGAHRLQAL